jgi:molybdopterin converting factor small subunit
VIEAKVHFFGPVRGMVRKKQQVVVLDDGATLRGLLDELGRSNGPEFQSYIVVEGATLNPAILVALNGESVNRIQNLDTPLPQGSVVDVMLAVAIRGG